MVSAKFLCILGLLALVSCLPNRPTVKTSSTKVSSTSKISSTSRVSTTSTKTTTTAPPRATVSVYGQCGGQGFTGSTICEDNTICTFNSVFNSQCLPGPNYTAPPKPTPTTTYTPKPQPTWSYAISFGDGFSDTGFDIKGVQPSIGNQLGNPVWPGLTTDAGPNWVADILKDNPGLVSYNFADGGATIDSSLIVPKVAGARSLVDQVAEFTSHLVPAPATAPWVFNNTFFVFWIGNNDVLNAYKQSNWPTLYPKIIDRYFEQVDILYNAGGRGFIFLGVPTLERTPAMLLQSAADRTALAAAISQFNAYLSSKQDTLRAKLGGNSFPANAEYMNFAQYVSPGMAYEFMTDNPTAYGFPDAKCYNADGVSCLWTDLWNPGQLLQSLIATYIAEIPGIPYYV